GLLELRLAASSADARLTVQVALTGAERQVDHTRRLHAPIEPEPAGRARTPRVRGARRARAGGAAPPGLRGPGATGPRGRGGAGGPRRRVPGGAARAAPRPRRAH